MESNLTERAVLSARDLFPGGASVLAACSGGPDSIALAAALVRCAAILDVRVAIGHVDHGLRPESAGDAEHVRSVASRLGVPFHLARLESVDTSELGLEAAAREHRYRALDSLARAAGADRVATAHTRRDQAETVLLRLARGGGPGALAGIRRSRALSPGVLLVRPLLEVPRAATEAYCDAAGLPVLADPHNDDPRRTRTRLRQLFPAIAAALNPRLEEALEASEKRDRESQGRIADLGSRLNVALAQRVQELSRYRSEFFGRLRSILGNRPDIRIVGDRFVFQSEVFFDTGQALLLPEGRAELEKLATALTELDKQIPPEIGWVLRVDGHTDVRPINSPLFKSNWELSAGRAISVVQYLVSLGVPAQRLVAAGFAEFQPLDTAPTEEAYKRNRRIELKLTER